MRSIALGLGLGLAVSVYADQTSLDCPIRQIGLDFAKSQQPFRASSVFEETADALNGAIEVQVRA